MLLNIVTSFSELELKKNNIDEPICLDINNQKYYVAIATAGNSLFAIKLEFKISETLLSKIMDLYEQKNPQQMWRFILKVDNGLKDSGKGGYLFDGFAFLLEDAELTEVKSDKVAITGFCDDAIIIGAVRGKDGNLVDYGKSYRIKLVNDYGSTAICPFIDKNVYKSVIAKKEDIYNKNVYFGFNVFRKKDSYNYELAINELSFQNKTEENQIDVNLFVSMLDNNSHKEMEESEKGEGLSNDVESDYVVSDDDLPF